MGKKKKESRKHKRKKYESTYTSTDETESDSEYERKRKKKHKEKKKKFRKPRRRRSTSSEASMHELGELDDILRTPPKHQKVKRVMYKRKMKNLDPDTFLSLRKFAYDKEKMVEQAFLTLRRGVLEKICPKELEHLSVDELKSKLIKLATTMSKERLKSYLNDDDLTHSSASSEESTSTDLSESELEIVEADELLNYISEEKRKAEEDENEMRERLARKIIEKKVLKRKKELEEEKKKALEDGEIASDEDNELPNIQPYGVAPIPPQPPDLLMIPPPPPPLEDDSNHGVESEIKDDKKTEKNKNENKNNQEQKDVEQKDTEKDEDDNRKEKNKEKVDGNKSSEDSKIDENTVSLRTDSTCSIILHYDHTAKLTNDDALMVGVPSTSKVKLTEETVVNNEASSKLIVNPSKQSLSIEDEIDYEDDLGDDPDIDLC